MKLIYPDYRYRMKFIEGKVNVVVIENTKEFTHLIGEILTQIDGCDGRFVLSDNEELMKISNHIQCIIDPFSMKLNSKKILDKIYTLCKQEIMDSELFIQQEQLFTDTIIFIEKVIDKLDYPLCYTDEFDIKSVFKSVNLKLQDNQCSLLEKVIDYIKINNIMLNINIFMFINLKSYLNDNELELLYKTASYEKIFLVLVEAHDFNSKSDYENKYIIDQDCCEIY